MHQVSSFLPTHNVVLSFDIKDATLRNQYLFNLCVKALVCPLVMTWDCSFLFCQSRRVALKLDQSNPAKKSHLQRFASRQANSIRRQLISVLCTYWQMMDYDKRSHIHWTYQYMSLQAGDSNVQPVSIFVLEIAVDVRHMMDYDN